MTFVQFINNVQMFAQHKGYAGVKKSKNFHFSPGQVKSNFYLSYCQITCPKYIVKYTCTEFFTCPPDIG